MQLSHQNTHCTSLKRHPAGVIDPIIKSMNFSVRLFTFIKKIGTFPCFLNSIQATLLEPFRDLLYNSLE